MPWLAKLGNLLADAPMPTAYRPVGRGITREKLGEFVGEAWLKACEVPTAREPSDSELRKYIEHC